MLNMKSNIQPDCQSRIYQYEGKFFAETVMAQNTITGYQPIRSDPQDTPELAKTFLKAKLEALKEREENFIKNPLLLMEHLCQNHDWTYQFSDDHSAWTAGNAVNRIMSQIVKLEGDQAREIWNKYAPDDIFRCHI